MKFRHVSVAFVAVAVWGPFSAAAKGQEVGVDEPAALAQEFERIKVLGLKPAQSDAPTAPKELGPSRAEIDAARAAQVDEMTLNYARALQPAMWRELDFVRQTCDLRPEQRPKIRAAAEAAVKKAAREILEPPQPKGGARPSSARETLRRELVRSLEESLPSQQFSRFADEYRRRTLAVKQATVLSVVAQIDELLLLSAKQRDLITTALETNWEEDWVNWLKLRQFDEVSFPPVPDQCVRPYLSGPQKEIWRDVQKAEISSWDDDLNERPADDEWWAGKLGAIER